MLVYGCSILLPLPWSLPIGGTFTVLLVTLGRTEANPGKWLPPVGLMDVKPGNLLILPKELGLIEPLNDIHLPVTDATIVGDGKFCGKRQIYDGKMSVNNERNV